MEISIPSLSTTFIRDLYARMLLTRIVDDRAWRLFGYGHERNELVVTCCGHEAAQVGSATCIEIGKDFTLPYYRDLGVVLTIGMTPYEVFRTYLQVRQVRAKQTDQSDSNSRNDYVDVKSLQSVMHWGYYKHNTVTGSVPVATQVLHAAGIAFAAKLRKASVVTVAYAGDGADNEPDFLEGITFAAQHQLPAVFVYEQDNSASSRQTLPEGLKHQSIDGTDIIAVYEATRAAMQHARAGHGPVLLEMNVPYSTPGAFYLDLENQNDPLLRCQQYMKEQGMWDDEWAKQLHERLKNEVEQALQDALRDVS